MKRKKTTQTIKVDYHPSGEKIFFFEENHIYKTKKIKSFKSVTKIIKDDNFPEFDVEEVSKRYAAKNGLDQEEVKKEWEENRIVASSFGTKVHLFAENYLLNEELPEPSSDKEKKYFKATKKFIDEYFSDKKLLASEKIICSLDYKIAGMVDLIAVDEKDNLLILDWKTNKAIKTDNKFQSGLGKLSHLDDCNYNHYSLQLSMYRKIMEMEGYEEIKERNCIMSLFHIRENKVKEYKCPYLKDEVEYILKKLK